MTWLPVLLFPLALTLLPPTSAGPLGATNKINENLNKREVNEDKREAAEAEDATLAKKSLSRIRDDRMPKEDNGVLGTLANIAVWYPGGKRAAAGGPAGGPALSKRSLSHFRGDTWRDGRGNYGMSGYPVGGSDDVIYSGKRAAAQAGDKALAKKSLSRIREPPRKGSKVMGVLANIAALSG